jgi:predicted nucleic acid-binding protein
MAYLLDTNVISELRRPRPHPAILDWLGKSSNSDLYLSAVTFGELQAGVEVIRDQDAAKASAIEAWIDRITGSYSIIPMDERCFREWARLIRRQNDLSQDAMIAATAQVNGLVVATRNTRDFETLGVETFNPFQRP